ncbi:hypothetical protein QBC35DRAFT_461818 [Podospora australis]|uniref:Urease accessory protein UreF n=1 Tax=Podospora australis TaxID=1536484 RepID=A0AAN7AI90_9PEZI|nr:hypothetical protein QBC35DRAFT_461818 [Podospora australis]
MKQSDEDINNEIADLERRLAEAKARRSRQPPPPPPLTSSPSRPTRQNLSNHFHLLLSDSALPLGSFAFSSGLESYLMHGKTGHHTHTSFPAFLPISVSSYASTTLPFVLSAHRDPSFSNLCELDDAQDATIICTVGKRASVAQGRALLGIYERSFATAPGVSFPRQATDDLKQYSRLLKLQSGRADDGGPPAVSAHLAPLFGAICRLVGMSLEQTAYVFMLGHVKALVSAAVRAGMFGPYQAQKTLAGGTVRTLITAMVDREWETRVEAAGQNVPVMDLWFGRHEVLYSRIFHS